MAVIAVLYFLAIMPRMMHKPDKTPFMGVLYAHRGLHDNATDAPENSMAAFRKAVEAGYGIELDVQLSKDRVPVIFHDSTLKRMCGVEGKVEEYTYEELQQFHLADSGERIPKFEDFLKLVDGRVPLIVELKIEGHSMEVCPRADALLQSYKGVYCIESFHPLAVRWYRNHRPEVFRGQLSDGFRGGGIYKGIVYFALEYLLFNFLSKPDFIAYNHHYAKNLSRRLCRGLYRNVAVAWTIRSMEELDAAREEFDLFIFEGFIPV